MLWRVYYPCYIYLFVRSKLEYASVVWFPHYKNRVDILERVLRRFLKFLSFRADGIYPPIGYSQFKLLERFSVLSLSERSKTAKVIFLFKLLNSNFDCPSLLSQIKFHIKYRSYGPRYKSLLYLQTPRTEILKYSPLQMMCRIGNYASQHVDLFDTTINELKRLSFSDISWSFMESCFVYVLS